jgi:hypothetical protein
MGDRSLEGDEGQLEYAWDRVRMVPYVLKCGMGGMQNVSLGSLPLDLPPEDVLKQHRLLVLLLMLLLPRSVDRPRTRWSLHLPVPHSSGLLHLADQERLHVRRRVTNVLRLPVASRLNQGALVLLPEVCLAAALLLDSQRSEMTLALLLLEA